MRFANLDGRVVITTPEGGIDLAEASDGQFSSDPDTAVIRHEAIREWLSAAEPALDAGLSTDALAGDLSRLGPPITRPRQIFAIGLNYRSHAEETGMAVPEHPMIFTKFASSLAGPGVDVRLPSATVDWEVELVVVIGRGGRGIPSDRALDHVAGVCVGQDLSDRGLQMANTPAQFSLAKSHEAFAPIGPWVTTLDELDDPTDLSIECRVDDEVVQSARTSQMIFDVGFQIAYLSSICELYPGDLLFSGTPEGVGMGRTPPQYLEPGQLLVSDIEMLGSLRNRCRA